MSEKTLQSWYISQDGTEMRVNFMRYTVPLSPLKPETFPCNTFAYPIDVVRLPMGFWGRLGFKAMRTVYPMEEISTMDRWCFWRALSDVGKKKLIHRARQYRTPFCHECGKYLDPEERE